MTKLSEKHHLHLSEGVQVMLLMVAFIWLRSGLGKVWGGEFVSGLAKTSGFFASKNPYPVVKDFLLGVVIPNATFFATLTMWGEVLSGAAIAGSIAYMLLTRQVTKNILYVLLLGLAGGAFLNIIFYFSAGWTSPSTESLNLLMGVIHIVGFILGVRVLRSL